MALIRATDTKPELVVRRLIHAWGFRFRLHDKKLPGHPDIVLRSLRKVIFVHGCFWHQHEGCGRTPKTRLDFWLPKLNGNKMRDKQQLSILNAAGWDVLVVWECETADPARLFPKLLDFLSTSHT